MAEELKERKYAKSEADGFNCAVELIETLEKNDSVFRDTFLKAFMPGFKHFAVLPHAIDKTEMKLKKIAEAKVIVSARVADKKAAKSKIESAKKAKRDLKNALNPGSSSAVEPSKVARKSRGGSASDSAIRMLMLKWAAGVGSGARVGFGAGDAACVPHGLTRTEYRDRVLRVVSCMG